jgi:hypothetical protein
MQGVPKPVDFSNENAKRDEEDHRPEGVVYPHAPKNNSAYVTLEDQFACRAFLEAVWRTTAGSYAASTQTA